MADGTRPYRPSNGTEGDFFYADWCARCTREQGARKCSILTRTLIFGVDDAEYPKEWVQDAGAEWPGNPRCTAAKPPVRAAAEHDPRQAADRDAAMSAGLTGFPTEAAG